MSLRKFPNFLLFLAAVVIGFAISYHNGWLAKQHESEAIIGRELAALIFSILYLPMWTGLVWWPLLLLVKGVGAGNLKNRDGNCIAFYVALFCFAAAMISVIFGAKKDFDRHSLRNEVTRILALPPDENNWKDVNTSEHTARLTVSNWLRNEKSGISPDKLLEVAHVFSNSGWIIGEVITHPAADKDLLRKVFEILKQRDRNRGGDFELYLTLVKHPAVSDDFLREIFQQFQDYDVRKAIIEKCGDRQPDLHREFLIMAASGEVYQRSGAACNPLLPVELMDGLAANANFNVRKSLASNPNIPFALLEKLNQDTTWDVRLAVINNAKSPPEWKTQFFLDAAHDENGIYRMRVAERKAVPVEILRELAKDKDEDTRAAVAENPATTPDVLSYLSRDEDTAVRVRVARNANCPEQDLNKLCKDPQELVRRVAEDTLHELNMRELEQKQRSQP